MSLIKCDECGRKISDQSLFCPNCGHPTHLNSAYPFKDKTPEEFERLAAAVASISPKKPAAAERPQSPTTPATPEPVAAEPVKPAEPEVKEPEPEAKAEETVAEVVAETPAEPEATEEEEEAPQEEESLETPARNRAKVWIFLGVSLAVLGVILYFYFTAAPAATEEGANTEVAVIDSVDNAATVPAAPDSIAPDAPAPAAPVPAAVKPAAATVAPKDAAEPELTMKSLSDQIAPPTAPADTTKH